jgi:hypothetical protein
LFCCCTAPTLLMCTPAVLLLYCFGCCHIAVGTALTLFRSTAALLLLFCCCIAAVLPRHCSCVLLLYCSHL